MCHSFSPLLTSPGFLPRQTPAHTHVTFKSRVHLPARAYTHAQILELWKVLRLNESLDWFESLHISDFRFSVQGSGETELLFFILRSIALEVKRAHFLSYFIVDTVTCFTVYFWSYFIVCSASTFIAFVTF